MQPRQMRETVRPVWPRVVNCMWEAWLTWTTAGRRLDDGWATGKLPVLVAVPESESVQARDHLRLELGIVLVVTPQAADGAEKFVLARVMRRTPTAPGEVPDDP